MLCLSSKLGKLLGLISPLSIVIVLHSVTATGSGRYRDNGEIDFTLYTLYISVCSLTDSGTIDSLREEFKSNPVLTFTIHLKSFNRCGFCPELQKFEKPWFTAVLNVKVMQPRRHMGALVGLAPPNKAPCASKNMKHHKLVEFLSNLNVKPPRTNVKPPYWRLSYDGSEVMP